MAERRKKRPRDPIALAKRLGDIATGQVEGREPDNRNPAAIELGRKGGIKGGTARAQKLSERRRKQIAKKAAHALGGPRNEPLACCLDFFLSDVFLFRLW